MQKEYLIRLFTLNKCSTTAPSARFFSVVSFCSHVRRPWFISLMSDADGDITPWDWTMFTHDIDLIQTVSKGVIVWHGIRSTFIFTIQEDMFNNPLGLSAWYVCSIFLNADKLFLASLLTCFSSVCLTDNNETLSNVYGGCEDRPGLWKQASSICVSCMLRILF